MLAKYLKETSDMFYLLCFGDEASDNLIGYCNSDCIGQLKDKSISRYVFLLQQVYDKL